MATLTKCPYPDHPGRCKAAQGSAHGTAGQCEHLAVEGKEYCQIHGGAGQGRGVSEAQKSLVRYKMTVLQARMEEMATEHGNDPVLGLRSEIALLRAKLELLVNQCKGPADLMIHSQSINMTVQLVGKLVVDARKLESSLGHLLDKSTVMILCDKIVSVVGTSVASLGALLPPNYDIGNLLADIGTKIGAEIESAVMKRMQSEDVEKHR